MTDVSKFDDVIDSRDVIARLEELEEARKPWRAGWNMPGYMPDSEPAGFATFEEARDYLVEEMNRATEGLDEKDDAEELCDLQAAAGRWEAIEDEAEQGETVGKWHYWIAKVDGKDAFDDEAEHDEYVALKALADEASGYSEDWEHGATLVRDSYFTEYAEQLADDICPYPRNSPEAKALDSWPYCHIDWDAAAEALKQDYTAVEFDDVTYWVR